MLICFYKKMMFCEMFLFGLAKLGADTRKLV